MNQISQKAVKMIDQKQHPSQWEWSQGYKHTKLFQARVMFRSPYFCVHPNTRPVVTLPFWDRYQHSCLSTFMLWPTLGCGFMHGTAGNLNRLLKGWWILQTHRLVAKIMCFIVTSTECSNMDIPLDSCSFLFLACTEVSSLISTNCSLMMVHSHSLAIIVSINRL